MINRQWVREFSSRGLQLRPAAAKMVTSFLKTCDKPEKTAEILVAHTKNYLVSKTGVVSPFVDADVIQAVVELMVEGEQRKEDIGEQNVEEAVRNAMATTDLGDCIQIYNTLTDVRPFEYKRADRAWVPCQGKPKLFAAADMKAKIYQERFYILWQRLLLEGEYVPEAIAKGQPLLPHQKVLTPVESLAGNPGRKVTFGVICSEHSSAGVRRWAIEDLHRSYPVELLVPDSQTLITDGCFVLAEGELVNDVFRISSIDVPPAVGRAVTDDKDDVPSDAFGGNLTNSQLEQLQKSEVEYQDDLFIVLSEVHLDCIRTIDKLGELFQSFEANPPKAYIFMGNFHSSKFVQTQVGVQKYKEGFERLKLILKNQSEHIRNGTRFVFIPGPDDPGAGTLPRAPLPNYLTSDLAQEIPGVVMTSNPCRIRHFSRELVFFRHDILRLMRRHEVLPFRTAAGDPPEPQQVVQEAVRLLFDQAHLVPLPLQESNIIWSCDHALRLYPQPHALFIGGLNKPFDTKDPAGQYNRFASVGPFHHDATFYAYHPLKDEAEKCNVFDAAG